MHDRIASAPVRTVVRAAAVMVAATMLAAAAASGVVAQTPTSPAAARKAQPNLFQTPAPAKTSPLDKTSPLKQTTSCSSYGDGFVNVPGTDTCVKAGGYTRTDAAGNR